MSNNLVKEHIYSSFQDIDENFDKAYFEKIKDCFFLAIECVKQQDGYIFFTDINKNIIAAFSFEKNEKLEKWVGKRIAFNFDSDDSKMTKTFIDLDRKYKLYQYIYKVNMFDISQYYLYFISESEKDLEYMNMFNSINDNIEKYISLIDKHANHNDLLLRALDSVNEGISFCDRDGYLIYVNKACCSILGASKEELMGKKMDKLSRDKPLLREIIDTKKSVIDVEYFLRFKEKTVQLTNSGYPVFDGKRDVIGAIDIFRSIERSRKLTSTMAGYEAFFRFDHIIGESRKIKENIKLAKVFAKSSENILIIGESGTGKELFAQAIHNYSNRRNKPFIALNCANFPNELVDSELFGYEEGSFTGAKKGGKPGKFELAHGGTLFLDELGEMPIHIQAKLLRVLETMCINRIGGTRPFKVDVRVIAATNRRLEKLVEQGEFRSDLYYRLKVLYIEVSSLKEREKDVLILADYFIKKFSEKMQKNISGLSSGSKEAIMQYAWPGNIRELENTLSRCMYICDGEYITEENLAMAGLKEYKYEGFIKREAIKIDKKALTDALELTNGNKKKVSELLGISRPTLYKLLKEYKI
jgi:PAS domain S-box-containing protein